MTLIWGWRRTVNWDRIDLKPFEKNFYNATSASRNMDQRLVEQFRNEHEIAIVKAGNNVPNPIMRFEDGGLPAYVMSEAHRAEFAAHTLAQTGSEKTGVPPPWHHPLQQPALPGGEGGWAHSGAGACSYQGVAQQISLAKPSEEYLCVWWSSHGPSAKGH